MELKDLPSCIRKTAVASCNEVRKQVARIKRRPWRFALGLVSWGIQSLSLSDYIAFVHSGRYFYEETWLMRLLWFIGFGLFLVHIVRAIYNTHQTGGEIDWLPIGIVLFFALMTYWLYIPSQAPGLAHKENQNDLRQFLSDHEYDVNELVKSAVRLHGREEYAWSYIYFQTAINAHRSPLNQFYPFYISDLFQIGKDKEATNAATAMLDAIQTDFSQRWPTTSASNILSATLDNIYAASMPLSQTQKIFFKSLAEQVNADYGRSITNIPPNR